MKGKLYDIPPLIDTGGGNAPRNVAKVPAKSRGEENGKLMLAWV